MNKLILQKFISTDGCYAIAKGDFMDYKYQVPIFVFTKEIPKKAAKGEKEKQSSRFRFNES